MSDDDFRLGLSTGAIASSETAIHLLEQKERLESAIIKNDIPLTLDSAKSFLESVFKTILSDRLDEPNLNQDFGPLYREVKQLIPFNSDSKANDILQKMGSQIVHNLGELRNAYGATSHGSDGYFENPIETPEIEMIVSTVDGLASCIYKKHKSQLSPIEASRIFYADYPEFNDWLDEQFDGYTITLSDTNHIEFTASKLIFSQDPKEYREMLLQYSSTEAEDEDLEDSSL